MTGRVKVGPFGAGIISQAYAEKLANRLAQAKMAAVSLVPMEMLPTNNTPHTTTNGVHIALPLLFLLERFTSCSLKLKTKKIKPGKSNRLTTCRPLARTGVNR